MKPAILLLAIVMLVSSSSVRAQRLFFAFGHAEYAAPLGDLRSGYANGLGVEAGIGLGFKSTFFTATTGYTWLMPQDDNSPAGNLRYQPFKLGVRKYLLRRNIFVKADAGLAGMKSEHSRDGSTHFTAGLGAGLKLATFEVLGEYTTVSGGWGSWLSIKAGLAIGL
ncbi:MAG TPA: hypothetical protein VF145_09190 [Chitinophagaceae bacterium]